MPFIGPSLFVGKIRSLITLAESIFAAFKVRAIAASATIEAELSVMNGLKRLDDVGVLKEASFILLPSAYKSGVLYAQVPNDGNGNLTWVRGGTANRTNQSGVIELMASGVPRLSYMYGSNPAVLLEPQRTNSIRNSSMVGAVSGSPGTIPSNWASVLLSGLTQTIVGTGVEIGLPYIDLKFSGTATGASVRIGMEGTSVISASNGQTWTYSFYSKLIEAPSAPNNYNLYTQQLATGGTNLGQFQTAFTPTSTLQRYTQTFTTNQATIANIRPYFWAELTNGATYDFTIRIAAPQMELGGFATTWVNTIGAAATRIADSFSRLNIYTNGLISANGGTWFVELRGNSLYLRDGYSPALVLADNAMSGGVGGNGWMIRHPSTSNQRLGIQKVVAGTNTALHTTATDNVKIAIKWNGTTADIFVNGTKVVSATSFTPTVMELLNGNAGDVPKFIQAMALAATPLSDARLIALTTL